MKAVLVTAILVSLVYLTFRYRDTIAAWFPGVKTYLWNAIVGSSGVIAAIFAELGKLDWRTLMTPENAALATIVIAVVGILLREVTEPKGDGS